MSFAATPLGQGSRRLDHSTFLGKNNTQQPPSSPRLVPTSYTYGAPTRSPPKSPARERTNILDESDSALARFARIKQRENSLNSLASRPGGPKIITSPPNPEKWSVKDTSVNIATAFHQAADMPPSNPNSAWASGATKPNAVPRSTSVEYEKESQSALQRRLAAPTSRISNSGRSNARGKPLSKSGSLQQIPDSEGEEEQSQHLNGRGKSPFNALLDAGSKALSAATYYARAGSREPENRAANTSNGNEASYEAEEKEFQALRKAATNHKRNRMSTDNKAYKPSMSDLEESDEDFEEDGKTRRRKKKKKEALGGPLSTLPVLSQDKRRKKRKADSRGNIQTDNEDGTDDSQSINQPHRGSVPPLQQDPDTSFDLEQHLPEEDSMDVDPRPSSQDGLGAAMGSLVFHLSRTAYQSASWLLTSLLYITGRLFGTIFDLILLRPKQIFSGPAGKYLILALIIFGAWCLRDPLVSNLPFSSSPYRPPKVPAANIDELNSRLLRIENTLSILASDAERTKTRIETESKNHADFIGRLGSLESKVQKDSTRSADSEAQLRDSTSKGLQAVKHEVEQLQAQLQAVQQQPPRGQSDGIGSDEEARAKLKALEERVGTIEGGVKEALEAGKQSTKVGAAGLAWWNKALSSKKAVTIKSSDGQDVTGLIGRLVETAVSRYNKDYLAKPDWALHSSGAHVIPSLTSPTYEVRPQNLRGQLIGLITGNGYAIARPPITALHHELHHGHCWPFAGTQGQLGVALAAPVYISDISIDHVAKEVAFDMRSAPRQMEVWAMVEGKDNISKVKAWKAEQQANRAEALERGETVEVEEYPKTLPKSPLYIRIATFNYNIHSPDNIQTFPVLLEVKELGIDFGIVVLRILNNWGRDEYTCLYRMRVHGERMGETPLPYPEEY